MTTAKEMVDLANKHKHLNVENILKEMRHRAMNLHVTNMEWGSKLKPEEIDTLKKLGYTVTESQDSFGIRYLIEA